MQEATSRRRGHLKYRSVLLERVTFGVADWFTRAAVHTIDKLIEDARLPYPEGAISGRCHMRKYEEGVILGRCHMGQTGKRWRRTA